MTFLKGHEGNMKIGLPVGRYIDIHIFMKNQNWEIFKKQTMTYVSVSLDYNAIIKTLTVEMKTISILKRIRWIDCQT